MGATCSPSPTSMCSCPRNAPSNCPGRAVRTSMTNSPQSGIRTTKSGQVSSFEYGGSYQTVASSLRPTVRASAVRRMAAWNQTGHRAILLQTAERGSAHARSSLGGHVDRPVAHLHPRRVHPQAIRKACTSHPST